MNGVLVGASALLLVNIAIGVGRLIRGPSAADRMVSALLFGTSGVGSLLLLAELTGEHALQDVALVLVMLSQVGVMVFVLRAGRRA